MPVQQTMIAPPRCRMGPITDAERAQVRAGSPVGSRYDTAINRESAAELLARAQKTVEKAQPAARSREQDEAQEGGFGQAIKDAIFGTKRRQGMIETMAKQTTRTVGTSWATRSCAASWVASSAASVDLPLPGSEPFPWKGSDPHPPQLPVPSRKEVVLHVALASPCRKSTALITASGHARLKAELDELWRAPPGGGEGTGRGRCGRRPFRERRVHLSQEAAGRDRPSRAT
jgi:hypothetical protein